MQRHDRLYRHSGRFSLVGLLIALPICAAIIFVMSVIYGHGMALIGWIWLNTIMVFFYGIGIGAVVGFALHFGKCRNIWLAGVIAVVGALFGEYLSWSIWVYDIYEEIIGDAAHTYSIAKIWDLAKDFAANGSYVLITGTELRGFMIWIAWGLEFITVLGMAFWIAALVSAMGKFCEQCGHWSDKTLTLTGLENRPISEISPKKLKEGDFSGLLDMTWAKASDTTRMKITVEHCTGCKNFHVFALSRTEKKKNDDGKLVTNETTLIDDLIITAEEFHLIEEMRGNRPKEVRREESREAGR